MMTPTAARKALIRKTRGAPGVVYYAVGIQVQPRRGATFSMRYTPSTSARAAARTLREKMKRQRVGMIGEVILASVDANESVSLGGYIRREQGRLEPFAGDAKRGAIVRPR